MKITRLFKHIFVLLIIIGFAFTFIGCQKSEDNSKPDDTKKTDEPVDNHDDQPTDTPDDNNNEQVDEGYDITFTLDDSVTITIYKTQADMTDSVNGEKTLTCKSRNSDTGDATSTDGQVNFVLEFTEGYELDEIKIEGTYNKLKGSADTLVENGYRITKVGSNLNVIIKAKEKSAEENLEDGYKVTFVCDSNSEVTVYPTQDVTTGGEKTNVAYSRDSATGALTKTDGQVNFTLELTSGYDVDEITVEGSYKNLKDETTDVIPTFRITKIASDLTVTIKTKVHEEPDVPLESISEVIIKSVLDGEEKELTVTITSEYFEYKYQDDVLTLIPSTTLDSPVFNLVGVFNGSIEVIANDNQSLELALMNVTICAQGTLPAIYISSADEAAISAKKGTENFIYDKREAVDALSSAVYVVCDLTLKGNGSLTVESTNNNGIHTKDDLEVKNLTLSVNCVDNALKGNDGVVITSGKLTLIARQGDGIKTSNSVKKYNDDGSLKKVQGTISIVSGTVNIYAACDGIDASYNAEISGDAVVNIYTDKYSSYSEEVTIASESTLYIRNNSSNYKYSVYFYNSDTDYVWKNSSSYKTVNGGRTTYYYYEIEKPSGYSNMIVYIYSTNQEQGQSTNYYVKSANTTINTSYDTFAYSSQRGTFSWTNYTTSQSGPGGPGGMSQGNPNKGDYSTKGIKADNEIIISGGTITIKSYDDCIHTNNDVVLGDEDDQTDDYYGTGNITISGGSLTLYSNDDGIHADQDLVIEGSALINITNAYEGVEANRIYVKGGVLYVVASDDAMNAAKCNGKYTPSVEISGGYVDLAVGSGDTDTLDSNGNVTISGGVLILKNAQSNGTSRTGGTMDLDGRLTITGGAVISIGCWCQEASMTGQASNTSTTLAKGTYTVKDSSGNEITSFTLSQSYRGYRIYFYGKSGTYTLLCDEKELFTF